MKALLEKLKSPTTLTAILGAIFVIARALGAPISEDLENTLLKVILIVIGLLAGDQFSITSIFDLFRSSKSDAKPKA